MPLRVCFAELVCIWFCCVCCEIRFYFDYAYDDEKFGGFFDIKFYNYDLSNLQILFKKYLKFCLIIFL